MKILITGGCGFLGSNLAKDAISKGQELLVFDNLSRVGSAENLEWLKSIGKFIFTNGDIRNPDDVTNIFKYFKPDAIFHLAGQVAMTTSITNPRADFETNAFGTFNLLEAARISVPNSIIIYSSTNKVYGDLTQYEYIESSTRYKCEEKPRGFDEKTPLEFHSPYGCSKGAADQYMLDYARIFDMRTLVFRHSSMYGGRQFPTFDQGWIGWFCQKALEFKNSVDKQGFSISGNGKQVRDLLHAYDLIRLYNSALDASDNIYGQAFNIGGGIENSLSLLELFSILNSKLEINLQYEQLPVRKSDQRIFVADITKVAENFLWQPKIGVNEGIDLMLHWLGANA